MALCLLLVVLPSWGQPPNMEQWVALCGQGNGWETTETAKTLQALSDEDFLTWLKTPMDNQGSLPIHVCVCAGNQGLFKELWRRARLYPEMFPFLLTSVDSGNNTALHMASCECHTPIVLALLEMGASVSALNDFGETPLLQTHLVGNAEVVQALITYGASVTVSNHVGETPLHLAAKWGKLDMLMILLNYGALVDARDSLAFTPLHLAVIYNQLEVALILLRNGALVTAGNIRNETPLMAAKGKPAMSKILNTWPVPDISPPLLEPITHNMSALKL